MWYAAIISNGAAPIPIYLDSILFAFNLLPKEENFNCKNILGAQSGVTHSYCRWKITGGAYNLQFDFYRMAAQSSKSDKEFSISITSPRTEGRVVLGLLTTKPADLAGEGGGGGGNRGREGLGRPRRNIKGESTDFFQGSMFPQR